MRDRIRQVSTIFPLSGALWVSSLILDRCGGVLQNRVFLRAAARSHAVHHGRTALQAMARVFPHSATNGFGSLADQTASIFGRR